MTAWLQDILDPAETDSHPVEQWRPTIADPRYEVSNWGRVRRNGHLLSPWPSGGTYGSSYLKVGFWKQGKRKCHFIHDLVLTAFVCPRPSPKHEGDHFDRDGHNNRLDNLQWLHADVNGFHTRFKSHE